MNWNCSTRVWIRTWVLWRYNRSLEFAVQFCWGHTAFQTRSTPPTPTPQTLALRIDTRQTTSTSNYRMKTKERNHQRERKLEEQPIFLLYWLRVGLWANFLSFTMHKVAFCVTGPFCFSLNHLAINKISTMWWRVDFLVARWFGGEMTVNLSNEVNLRAKFSPL